MGAHNDQFTRHPLPSIDSLCRVLASNHRACRDGCIPSRRRMANGHLDCCAGSTGSGVHSQCGSMWTNPLLPHRALFLGDGTCCSLVRPRHRVTRQKRLEPAESDCSGWWSGLVLPSRVVSWQILETSCSEGVVTHKRAQRTVIHDKRILRQSSFRHGKGLGGTVIHRDLNILDASAAKPIGNLLGSPVRKHPMVRVGDDAVNHAA